jgi:predicted dehydrogenase
MAEHKLRVGMIGAGFIGQLGHLMNYVEVRGCRVVALAEFRPELRRRVAERYGIARTYATHRELLKDPEVDAVVVVTPRAHTAPVVLDCIEAGKHVLSEKPMAGTSEQGQRLVDAARKRNVHYAVGYMKRHDEGVQAAKRLLDEAIKSGSLGPVLYARAHCYMGESYANADGHVVTEEKPDYAEAGWPTAPDWLPADWHRPFASFVNTYSHNTNLLRFLFNATPKIEYVSLTRQPGQLAVFDFGSFSATLETGRSSNRGWDEVTEVFFADGRLTLRTPPALLKNVPASVELYRAGKIQEVVSPQSTWTWSFRRQAQAFVDDILGKRESISSGADALQDLRLIEGMWRMEMRRA